MAERYTNIRVILDKLLRNPLLQDLNLETAIDYTVDFMRIVGTPAIFENKIDITGAQYCLADRICVLKNFSE